MKLLVVAAHGDDEALGCGGVLDKLDCEKEIVILSAEYIGRDKPADFAWAVGAKSHIRMFPDNKFDTVPFIEIVQAIEMMELTPDVILTHFEHDLNIDHRITYQAVMTAFRGGQETILSFEIPCSTGWALTPFNPNVFIDFNWDAKMELLKIYDSEMKDPPHPRSYENISDVERFKFIRGYDCIL